MVDVPPKTRSGKILGGKEYQMPSPIDDAFALTKIEEAVREMGYGRKAH